MIMILGFTNCSKNGFDTASSGGGVTNQGDAVTSPLVAGSNVMSVEIGACQGYYNEPCASVTVCTPGTTSCQTINNLLVDTGSYGLRVFKSLLNGVSLPSDTNSSGQVYAECQEYLSGQVTIGDLAYADVGMGGVTASKVPIQLIDGSITVPAACIDTGEGITYAGPITSPSQFGFNGILGIGPELQDCGSSCALSTAPNIYFLCSGNSCSPTKIPVLNQLTNPIALLPTGYNNGYIFELPAVPPGGSVDARGSIIFGLATAGNNTPSSLNILPIDSSDDVQTTYNGQSMAAFVDSGTNSLYFPAESNLPVCTDSNYNGYDLTGYFCPNSLTSVAAKMLGSAGTPTVPISFAVLSAEQIYSSSNGNWAFNDMGTVDTDSQLQEFDWGLPFFYGRTIAFALRNALVTGMGTGPFVAF